MNAEKTERRIRKLDKKGKSPHKIAKSLGIKQKYVEQVLRKGKH